MRSISLLLLVVLAAVEECHGGKHNSRAERDLLVRSKRRWVLSTIDLQEELKVEYPHQISKMFNDKTPGRTYAFVMSGDGVDEGLFTIDKNTGAVYVHRPIDREKTPSFHIKFDVMDTSTNSKIDKELAFDVDVKDINDNPPVFIQAPTKVGVLENTTEGYLPVFVETTDIDDPKSNNSKIIMTVISQDPEEPKIVADQLDAKHARLKFKGCFDYDKVKQYKVVIEAKDRGTPVLSSTTAVTLNILDTNSHVPVFKNRQYQAEALEMTIHKDLLRLAVDDKDTPLYAENRNAEYFFISGNENGMFKLETDQDTNDGLLSVVKKVNYERSTLVHLQIGVKNTGKLSVCKNGKLVVDPSALPPSDSVNVTITMIDTNDPPVFDRDTVDVYLEEEKDPGKELYTPKVQDVDSDVFRFELVEDPADWVSMDEKTGEITIKKKMDRESPFVGPDNIYKVVIAAIDDGKPPATSMNTINIHLKDANDHTPMLVNSSIIMCGNRDNSVIVSAEDRDADPYSGPFTFSLEDETMKEYWKLEPPYGLQTSLVSLKALLYGNYSVPLLIGDKQNEIGRQTLEVIVCDCGEKDVCRGKLPISSELGAAGIGLIIAGLLLFLILLFIFLCSCEDKPFKTLESEEGNQTLIQYNNEGGGSECKVEHTLLTSMQDVTVIDGLKQDYIVQKSEIPMATSMVTAHGTEQTMRNDYRRSQSLPWEKESQRSHNVYSAYSSWNSNNRQSYKAASAFNRNSSRFFSSQHFADQNYGQMNMFEENDVHGPEYRPVVYKYEDGNNDCYSLDRLSVSNLDDDFQFLDNLGPQFRALGEICRQTIPTKSGRV